MCVFVFVYVCVCVCVFVCVCVCVHLCMFVCMCTLLGILECVCAGQAECVCHYGLYLIVQAVLPTIFQTVSMDQWMTENMHSHKQQWLVMFNVYMNSTLLVMKFMSQTLVHTYCIHLLI